MVIQIHAVDHKLFPPGLFFRATALRVHSMERRNWRQTKTSKSNDFFSKRGSSSSRREGRHDDVENIKVGDVLKGKVKVGRTTNVLRFF